MLELVATDAAVATVMASPEALDALAPAGTYRCRIAPDEAMLMREPQAIDALIRDVGAARAGDPDAVVLDATDGWAIWTLTGDTALDSFQRLSALRLSEGFTQGDVANIPVRVVAAGGAIHLFVAAMWRDYLRAQILERCEVTAERDEPASWTLVGGAT